jgi:hypothetical protein
VVQSAPPLLCVVHLLDELVRGAQGSNLILHGLLEDTFLLENEGAFLVVVGCTGGPAVAVPPCGPVVLKLRAAAGTAAAALFATRGAFCSAGAAAEEGGIVSEMAEEERGERGKDYDDDDVFEELADVGMMVTV